MRSLGLAGLVFAAYLGTGASEPVHAQDAGAGQDASVAPVASADPRTAEIRALIDGQLDLTIEPQQLFEADLEDENAIQVERVRILALREALNQGARPAPAPPAHERKASHAPEPAAPSKLQADLAGIKALDAAGWRARLALDDARLDFFSLDPARRDALLRDQARRREAAKPRESEQARKARLAEAERQRALAAARAARSEAERAVSEELARLISLQSRVAAVREHLHQRRTDIATRRDAVLGWQRRVRSAMTGPAGDADELYTSLRRALKAGRDELDRALDELGAKRSAVPALGADALRDIPPDVATDAVRERRRLVASEIQSTRAEEDKLRRDRAAALIDEIDTLNRERLALLAFLSPDKRAANTGLNAVGWDQARSEARHLLLVLRYHRHVVLTWLGSIRTGGPSRIPLWRLVVVIVPWSLLVFAFLAERRRSPQLLALAEQRLAEIERQERRVTPNPIRRALRVLTSVHRSLEWLLFFAATLWLLPNAVQRLLEVEMLSSILGWVLAGALIVNVINAIAAESAGAFATADRAGTGRLRLRSLRLVGRVAVAFILVLVLTARLVGQGTVFNWVLSTCWLAGLLLFLVLVRWWRDTVFVRVGRARRKSALETWVLANRSGWKSFLAAMLGAVQLFSLGAIKFVRNWLAGWNLARHAHAYLFRRGLDRLASERNDEQTHALHDDAFDSLAPDAPYQAWIDGSGDRLAARLCARVKSKRGGVIAIVGARGHGKSSILRRTSEACHGAITLGCNSESSFASIRSALGIAEADATAVFPELILLDDAQRLLQPVIGGLATFDAVFGFARAHSATTLWVFAIDAVLWPFLRRARDSRPLFDEVAVLEPWTEEEIGALLAERSARAGIAPSFEDLLDKLPISADDIDRQDALKVKRQGYMRMLWDHVRGNPGIALQVWRSSLVVDVAGRVRVRSLQVPELEVLERLPDSTLFILRAVLQLGPASTSEVARSTRLSAEQIIDAFRFGEAQGYLNTSAGRTSVTWPWLREVLRLLERRHLLVDP